LAAFFCGLPWVKGRIYPTLKGLRIMPGTQPFQG